MTQIFEFYSDFLDRENKDINGVSKEFSLGNTNFEKENETNKGCWNCFGCSRCSDCSVCSRCFDLRNASPTERSEENPTAGFKVPIIEGIHKKVLDAVSNTGSLDMSRWHSCETTHCRAGWVVTLAGEEGKKLEDKTTTAFAAMQIYHASSPIKVSATNQKGIDLKNAVEKCNNQDATILQFFLNNHTKSFTPYEVWLATDKTMLLTSLRRSITNLTGKYLYITIEKRMGGYGRVNECWKAINPK